SISRSAKVIVTITDLLEAIIFWTYLISNRTLDEAANCTTMMTSFFPSPFPPLDRAGRLDSRRAIAADRRPVASYRRATFASAPVLPSAILCGPPAPGDPPGWSAHRDRFADRK